MDPAFLVWIPPLDESGEILPDESQEYHEMEDIKPKMYIDPGSNKESPEEEVLLPKLQKSLPNDNIQEVPLKFSPVLKMRNKRILPLVINVSTEELNNKYINEMQPLVHKSATTQMYQFPQKTVRLTKLSKTEIEKETEVEKPSSFDCDILNDLKFADEEDEDLAETECNINKSYQQSNILASS